MHVRPLGILVIPFVFPSFERFARAVTIGHQAFQAHSSTFGCIVRLRQLIGKPQLYERLASHAQPPRFTVEGIHHPCREIYVDPLGIGANSSCLRQI